MSDTTIDELSLDELLRTRAEVVALRRLGVERGYGLAVRMLDGALSDIDTTEKVMNRVAARQVLLQEAEDTIEREREIETEMREFPCLTRAQAEARVDQQREESDQWFANYKREQEERDILNEQVRQFLRKLNRVMTIREIKQATGHPVMISLWKLCKDVAAEGLLEPLPKHYKGYASHQVVPKRAT